MPGLGCASTWHQNDLPSIYPVLKVEAALVEAFSTFPGHLGKGFFLVLLIRAEHERERALVATDVTRLPPLSACGLGDNSRRSAVEVADAFLATIFPGLRQPLTLFSRTTTASSG